QPLGDHVEISRCLNRLDARLQSSDRVQVVRATVVLWPQRDRPPEVHRLSIRHRPVVTPYVLHARRHHANDGERFASKRDCFTNDPRITVESPFPYSVAENHDMMVAGCLVLATKLPTQHWSLPQNIEIAR